MGLMKYKLISHVIMRESTFLAGSYLPNCTFVWLCFFGVLIFK